MPKFEPPQIKLPKMDLGFEKASSREPVPAKRKKEVRERAKRTCEYRGCKYKLDLEFHHKDMRSDNNKLSNLELLCPNHHRRRHADYRRKTTSVDPITGEKKTRLVKKPKKKTPAKKKTTKTSTTKKKAPAKKKGGKKKKKDDYSIDFSGFKI